MLQAGLFQLVALQMGQTTMHRISRQLVLSQLARTLRGFSCEESCSNVSCNLRESIVFILELDMSQT